MSTGCAMSSAPNRRDTADETVWDLLWRNRPSDAKDDDRLQRERHGPRWNLIVHRLEQTFGGIAGLRTIELGSGRGDLSVLLARQGAQVTLVDRSERALDEARERFDRLSLAARFLKGDLLLGDRRWTGGYDVSLSVGVIEHFKGEARTRVLNMHADVLKPNGLCVVSVPHARCLPYRFWKSYLELRGWWPYGLEIPYGKAELHRRAVDAGLDRVETHALGFWQSVENLWGRRLFGRWPDWSRTPSRLDDHMGWVLLMFARRDGDIVPGRDNQS